MLGDASHSSSPRYYGTMVWVYLMRQERSRQTSEVIQINLNIFGHYNGLSPDTSQYFTKFWSSRGFREFLGIFHDSSIYISLIENSKCFFALKVSHPQKKFDSLNLLLKSLYSALQVLCRVLVDKMSLNSTYLKPLILTVTYECFCNFLPRYSQLSQSKGDKDNLLGHSRQTQDMEPTQNIAGPWSQQ